MEVLVGLKCVGSDFILIYYVREVVRKLNLS